jgi:hypothetical protein
MKRALKWIGITLGVLVLAAGGWFVYRMGPSNVWGMLRYDQREEGALKVGDVAPDVTLVALDGSPVRLRERLAARPTVLLFGSYT